jgi:predicted PurR-regulated permease PerM
MLSDRFSKFSIRIILLLIIIFLAGQIPYIMSPLTSVLSFILLPVLLSLFFYYLIRPLVRFLQPLIKSKALAVFISLLIVVCVLVLVFYFGGSIIYEQGKELSSNYRLVYDSMLEIFDKVKEYVDVELESTFLTEFNIRDRLYQYTNEIINKISSYNYMGIFSSLTNFGLIIILIPLVLFYFLKDDEKLVKNTLNALPKSRRKEIENLGYEIDQLLSTFIGSQLVVALFLGLVMFIGFIIIGLPNAAALALIAMIMSLVPIIGPFFGSLPAVFVAATNSWILFLGVLVIIVIAQYLEGNLIRPLVQGKRLEIHPLIVLFVVLSGVYLFGFIGALTAVPVYVVVRLIYKRKVLEENE